MVSATSLWHINPYHSELRSESSNPIPDTIPLYSLYSLISIGTERIVATGKVPSNLYSHMRVPYMEGDFNFPLKYGYSLIAADEKGKKYHIMHPHQTNIYVNRGDPYLLPDHLPAKRATLISNLETACNGYWDGNPAVNEKILIVGFGLIGALLAVWIKLKGHGKVSVLESNSHRRNLALKLGFEIIDESVSEKFELLYNTTSNSSGLQFCIDHANLEGRIVEMSWFGTQPVTVKLGESFHINRLSIKSSQVSRIPAQMKNIWNVESRKQEVIKMLQSEVWDELIESETSLKNAINWFDKIRSGPIDPLSLVIKY